MTGNGLSQRTEDLIEAIDQSLAIEGIFDRVSDLRGLFDVEHSVYFSTEATEKHIQSRTSKSSVSYS